MNKIPYREVVGDLLRCSLICRLDLSYAVNKVAKFNSNPGATHGLAVHRVLIYAYEYREWGILYHDPKDDNQVYDPVINFWSWADANSSID